MTLLASKRNPKFTQNELQVGGVKQSFLIKD